MSNCGLKERWSTKPTFSTAVIFGFVACPEGENPFTVKGNLNSYNKYLMERCQNAKTSYLMLQLQYMYV